MKTAVEILDCHGRLSFLPFPPNLPTTILPTMYFPGCRDFRLTNHGRQGFQYIAHGVRLQGWDYVVVYRGCKPSNGPNESRTGQQSRIVGTIWRSTRGWVCEVTERYSDPFRLTRSSASFRELQSVRVSRVQAENITFFCIASHCIPVSFHTILRFCEKRVGLEVKDSRSSDNHNHFSPGCGLIVDRYQARHSQWQAWLFVKHRPHTLDDP